MKLRRLAVMIALAGSMARAQTGVHACQAQPDLQKVYDLHRNSPDRVKALRDALATHPDDLFLNRWLLLSPDVRAGSLAAEYQAKLDAHPGAPLFLYLYGHALPGLDTPKAIGLINQAVARDPDLAYAYQTFIEIYASQNFHDRAKVTEYLKAFVARCPDDVSVYSHLDDVSDPDALRELTAQFRAAVEKRDTVGVAAVYTNLWAAEFRVENPKNYDGLREQVRLDIKRISELDPDNIDRSKSLIQGYRLIGDNSTADELQAKRVPVKSFDYVLHEWEKAHPSPGDPAGMVQASAQWVKDWPNETHAWYWRMNAIARNKASTALEIEKAGEDVLASNAKTFYAWTTVPYPHEVAQVWIEHDIRLKDCLGLLKQAKAELDGTSPLHDDRIPGTAPAASAPSVANMLFDIRRLEAEAHRKLGEYDEVRSVLAAMKVRIDAHPADPPIQDDDLA